MHTIQQSTKTAFVFYWSEQVEVPFLSVEDAFEPSLGKEGYWLSSINCKRDDYPERVARLNPEIMRHIEHSFSLVYPLSPHSFFLEIVEREGETLLFLKYSQIIGSRLLCKLDTKQGAERQLELEVAK